MERRTRRFVFYIFLGLFLVISYLMAVYAFGYRYDFIENKFVKTGSLQFKANVSADVYIDDRFAGRTSFLNNVFSETRFLPRSYSVRLQDPDYQIWQKTTAVSAGLVIDFPKIILLPKNFTEETVSSKSFVPAFPENKPESNKPINSPDSDKEAWFNEREIWVKWRKNTSYQPFKKSGDTELITRYSQLVNDVQWYKDSDHLIADVGGILKFIEIDTRGGINSYDLALTDGRFYYDRDVDRIYLQKGQILSQISLP
ncbi:MAG: hypothetical protein AAB566_01640 [Patescibacteria group bacterium]